MSEQLSHQEVLEQKRAHWKQHIEQWRFSEMTQKAYCQQHDLGYHQFSYWKKRFVQTETGITFVPLKIPRSLPLPTAMKTSPLRIIVNSNLQIEIGSDFDPHLLRRLIATLRTLP